MTAPDGTRRRATLTERIHSEYGETRYYVNSVALPQSIKTEAAARAEVSRLIGHGQLVGLPLAHDQAKPPERTRLTSLPGNAGIVETVHAGCRSVVEIRAREEMRQGRWQPAGYVATNLATYALEGRGRLTPFGYLISSQNKGNVIRDRTGVLITDLAQARQRARELAIETGPGTAAAARSSERHQSKVVGGATTPFKPRDFS
jgi:hypothetical protein